LRTSIHPPGTAISCPGPGGIGADREKQGDHQDPETHRPLTHRSRDRVSHAIDKGRLRVTREAPETQWLIIPEQVGTAPANWESCRWSEV